jgi:hypothetical protein
MTTSGEYENRQNEGQQQNDDCPHEHHGRTPARIRGEAYTILRGPSLFKRNPHLNPLRHFLEYS